MTQCPVCGGTDTEIVEEPATYVPAYIPPVHYTAPVSRCKDCTEAFPTDGYDEKVRAVYLDAHKAEVSAIIEWFRNRGLSRTYLERNLRLPFHTLDDWEAQGPAPGGLMLLRFARHTPSLLSAFRNGV